MSKSKIGTIKTAVLKIAAEIKALYKTIKEPIYDTVRKYDIGIRIIAFATALVSAIYILLIIIPWAGQNGMILGFKILAFIEGVQSDCSFVSLKITPMFILCAILLINGDILLSSKPKGEKIKGKTDIINIVNDTMRF